MCEASLPTVCSQMFANSVTQLSSGGLVYDVCHQLLGGVGHVPDQCPGAILEVGSLNERGTRNCGKTVRPINIPSRLLPDTKSSLQTDLQDHFCALPQPPPMQTMEMKQHGCTEGHLITRRVSRSPRLRPVIDFG